MLDPSLLSSTITSLRIDYVRAERCWRGNNLNSSLLICEQLGKNIHDIINSGQDSEDLVQLKHLIWFLKIRCLADDYYINESLLLNETDIEEDDQISVLERPTSSSTNRRPGTYFSSTTTTTTTRGLRTAIGSSSQFGDGGTTRRLNTAASLSRRTAVLTGRLPSRFSRQDSGRATASYRPLTTNLTANQAAFSRSTRLLLKYSTCQLLSKLAYEYLYNAQSITNSCPDYRQCLEYLNLVQNGIRNKLNQAGSATRLPFETKNQNLISTSNILSEKSFLGVFWLIAFGSCYYNLHMNKQAEEYFQQVINLDPKYLDSYTWLVKIYLRTNQPLKVLKICRQGLEQIKSPILYNWMARVQSLMGDLYAANENLRESLRFHPTNIEALANVGHFNFYDDKMDQSLMCFERIQQLSINQSVNLDANDISNINYASSSQLLNNLALCNFYAGFYHKVMPLFFKAFLNSPSKDVTSSIWYNISFVPLSFGFQSLTIACLKLALKNNSENKQAINNLGVIKFGHFINDEIHYPNKQELWGNTNSKNFNNTTNEDDSKNQQQEDNIEDYGEAKRKLFDEAETYFSQPNENAGCLDEQIRAISIDKQPETLYNMALIKRRRGQLLASIKYCSLYLEDDPNNYHIKNMMREIRQLVSHDG